MLPIRIRRGLSADRKNYTPANGELIVTTDTKELFVGDGVTAGGFDVTAAVKSVILDAVVSKDSLGVANGVATLDANGKVVTTQLPALAISSTNVVTTIAELLAIDNQEGDVVVVTDTSETYIRNAGTSGTIADYTLVLTPDDGVLTVNGKTGVVTLTTADIAEDPSNLYFTNARVLDVIRATSINELQDVSLTNKAEGDIIAIDDSGVITNQKIKNLVAAGNVSIEDLVDTPVAGAMATKAGSVLAVNSAGTGIVYAEFIDGGTF